MFKKVKKPLSFIIAVCFMFLPVNGYALPTDTSNAVGGSVVSGTATYDSSVANTLTVNQSSGHLIAEYNDFSIQTGEAVNFVQPGTTSVALNRVVTGNISQIFGSLNANGQILLVNQNGIVFQPGSSVNVHGLIASTLNISNADFLSDNMHFVGGEGFGKILNNGTITTKPGSYVALLGSRVENNGIVTASLGKIALGAGKDMTLSLDPDNMISIALPSPDANPDNANAGIINTGTLDAANGHVLLNSHILNGVFDNAINNTGIINAKHIMFEAENGDIVLTGASVNAVSNEVSEVDISVKEKGDINITNSNVNAIVNDPFEGKATIDMKTEDGGVNINSSDINATLNGYGDATVNIDASGGDINVSGGSLVKSEINGSAVDSGTSLTKFDTTNDIKVDSSSTVIAVAAGANNPAIVLALAEGAINAPGTLSALSDYISVVAMLGLDDVIAGNVLSQGSGDFDMMSWVNSFLGGHFGFNAVNQYDYSSGAIIASLRGNVYLGNITSDAVLAAALGLDGLFSSESEGGCGEGGFTMPEGFGAIYNLPGDITSNFTYLLARNDIGQINNPIATDTNIVAGYSYDSGNVVIDQVTDKTLEVGMFLPVEGETDLKGLGASLAANDGVVAVTSNKDMIINSIISTNGGVFLQSREGSIYAGQGWDPLVSPADVYCIAGDGCMGSLVSELLMDFPFEDEGYGSYLSPVMPVYPEDDMALNIIAAGYSYISTPNGTIGVGTQASKDPDISGQIAGHVNPLVTTVNGDQGTSLDLRFGPPPGYVTFSDEGTVQVWPAIIPGDPGAQTFENPLFVYVDVQTGAHSALPSGYPESGNIEDAAGLTLQIGNNQQLAGAIIPYLQEDRSWTAYYEGLQKYTLLTMAGTSPIQYFAYHPLTQTDESAFDDISLDAGAYDFINGTLNMKNPLAPYFGDDNEKEKKK